MSYLGIQPFSTTLADGDKGDITVAAGGTSVTLDDSAFGYFAPMKNGKIEVTAASSALTIAIKTLAGSDPSTTDPVDVFFRNVTGTVGNYVRIRLTAATSFVVSSGSTLNVTSAIAFRIWIVGFNDGGTFRLGVWQSKGTTTLPGGLYDGIYSSTAEGGAGAADSAGVIYTGTAVTSKAMRILGYAEWNTSGLTAGTWTTTNLSNVQLMGPGVPLPGSIVQRVIQGNNGGATSTTSSTFVATGSTVDITPSSPANLFYITTHGQVYTSGVIRVIVKIHRNGSAIGVGSEMYNMAGGIGTAISTSVVDSPNLTSAITYKVYVKNSDNTTQVQWNIGDGNTGSTIEVQEVMT